MGMKKPGLQLRLFTVEERGGTFTQPSSGVKGHGEPEGHGTDNKPADWSSSAFVCLEKPMD